MKNYFLNFGIWLGGMHVLEIIIARMGFYFPFMEIPIVLIGTILAVVMTHKAEQARIKFGPAFLAGLSTIGLFVIIGMILNILSYGTEYLSYYFEYVLLMLLIKVSIIISVLLGTGMWYMLEKANQPGWSMFIPIYNIIVMCKVAQKPLWYVVMFFIPIANIIFMIMMFNGISKSFGKSSGFTVGLVFLGQIFFAILGYGEAKYLAAGNNASEEVLDL